MLELPISNEDFTLLKNSQTSYLSHNNNNSINYRSNYLQRNGSLNLSNNVDLTNSYSHYLQQQNNTGVYGGNGNVFI